MKFTGWVGPSGKRALLESAAVLSGRRHWAVLGEMRELGADSARFHAELGRAAVERGFAPIVGVGAEARGLVEAAVASGGRAEWVADAAAAAAGFPVLRYQRARSRRLHGFLRRRDAREPGGRCARSGRRGQASLGCDPGDLAGRSAGRAGRRTRRRAQSGHRHQPPTPLRSASPCIRFIRPAGFILWEPIAKPAEFFRQQLRTLLFSQVAGGKKPDATVDQLLVRLESEGSIDVLGYALYRSLVHSFGDATLAAALDGPHAPVCLAQIQARGRLAPAHVALIGALQGAPDHTPAKASGSERVDYALALAGSAIRREPIGSEQFQASSGLLGFAASLATAVPRAGLNGSQSSFKMLLCSVSSISGRSLP